MSFLEDLRQFYSSAEITAVTSPAGKELLLNSNHVDKCIVSNVFYLQGVESVFSSKALKDILKIKRDMAPPYDIFVDLVSKYSLAGSLKPYVMKLFANPLFSIGLDYRKRGFFLDRKVFEDRKIPKHNILKYNDILDLLGCKADFHLPKISIPLEYEEKAKAFFQDFNDKPKIAFHPGANAKFFSHRAWPVERFASLADMISKNMDCHIFATGHSSEGKLLESFTQHCNVKIHLLPQTENIIEFCAFLKELDYYVANDTGPMHLAVAMGVPTVGIFGRSDYNSYGTYPQSVPFEAVTLDGQNFCGPSPIESDPRGLLEIEPEDVFKKFMSLT
jgi:ADP-heptose:LPS heptosyltransferase